MGCLKESCRDEGRIGWRDEDHRTRRTNATPKEERMSTESFRTKVLLRSEQTEGQVSVIENLVPAGWGGPPLHHHDFDEAFYVLDGELTFQLRDELVLARRGEVVFAPRGVHHTRQPEWCEGPLPTGLHPGWLRTPVRPNGRRAGRGLPAPRGL